MTGFDAREKAAEKYFELGDELGFKIASRAAKMFGLWVAGQLGLKDDKAEAYAQASVDIITEKSSHDHLLEKAEKDLHFKGITLSRHRLERELAGFHNTASEQILKHA